MTSSQKRDIAKKTYINGKRYAVIAAYSHAGYDGGDIISCHFTYTLARSAAGRSGYESFRAIRALDEYID